MAANSISNNLKYKWLKCANQKTHLRTKDLKVRGWKKNFQVNGHEKKGQGIKILLSDRIDFKMKIVTQHTATKGVDLKRGYNPNKHNAPNLGVLKYIFLKFRRN